MLQPSALQAVAGHPNAELVTSAMNAVDQVIMGMLPPAVHVATLLRQDAGTVVWTITMCCVSSLVRTLLLWECLCESVCESVCVCMYAYNPYCILFFFFSIGIRPYRATLLPLPRVESTKEDVEESASKVIAVSGIHAHTFTCGEDKCRLARPQGMVEATGFTQLTVEREGGRADGKRSYHVLDNLEPPPPVIAPCFRDPVPQGDRRLLKLECKRPLIDPEVLVHVLQEDPAGPLFDDICRGLQMYTREMAMPKVEAVIASVQKHADAITVRNGYVVETQPMLSAMARCNTNVALLGAAQEARSVMHYVGDYLTKDNSPMAHAAVLLHHAIESIHLFPSIAEDTGTPLRTAKHALTRMVNAMSGMCLI